MLINYTVLHVMYILFISFLSNPLPVEIYVKLLIGSMWDKP